ncbi:MAG TPA: O-methyltransferase [Chitinophagales bacterium]|nr:O-methyltransferase [Chitinophagales bacterium]
MHFFPEELEQYTVAHTKQASEVLQELERETYARIYMPQMVSGHLQGRFLSMISKMVQPKNILEIGTFTGYSAICLSEGLEEGGTLFTIDVNAELETMTRKYLGKAGVSDKIKYLIGNAVEIIPQLDVIFDLVFIDADKENYSRYYDLVFDKLRSGGVILADNVLWSGKVIEEKQDEETKALVAFSDKVQNDNRVENVMVTIRDGVMMIRKK